MQRERKHLHALAAMLLATAVLAGCHQPHGLNDGRMPTDVTSDAEASSNQVLPTALLEFSDQVAMELPQKLVQIPEIVAANNAGQRITVFVGDINNKTGVTSSNDLEMVRSRIRNSVLQSNALRAKVLFRDNRARVAALGAREGVATGEAAGREPLDPAITYFLSGDFYRVHRDTNKGDVNLYYMEFYLVSAKTQEVIPFAKYEVKQWRP